MLTRSQILVAVRVTPLVIIVISGMSDFLLLDTLVDTFHIEICFTIDLLIIFVLLLRTLQRALCLLDFHSLIAATVQSHIRVLII